MLVATFLVWALIAGTDPAGEPSPEQLVRQIAAEPPPEAAVTTEVERRIRGALTQPEGARFEWVGRWIPGSYRVSRSRFVYGYITCGRVRAPAAGGAAAGWKQILVVARGAEIVNLAMDVSRDMTIRSHCAAYGLR